MGLPTHTLALIVAAAVVICTVWPALLFLLNLRRYQPPPAAGPQVSPPAISVLIPARNEEQTIAAAIKGVLASQGVRLELIVLDDHSTDRTAAIVTDLSTDSASRLRLASAPPLPAGWNGKQHACWQLAQLAQYDILCFLDSDVQLAPAALARMAAFLDSARADLVSGFPRQVTATWLEKLLIPLIHYVLLSFLPMRAMRRSVSPAVAAGCGQFMMVRRDAYVTTGGHSAIRTTMHDGLLLPRLLRRAGRRTDLADLTALATCRMYTSAPDVWNGLAKNATEGIGAPARIVPISLILLLGQIVPAAITLLLFATALFFVTVGSTFGMDVHFAPHARWYVLALLALFALSLLPRILAARRFRQSLGSALLHPLGILVLLALQWYALARQLLGSPITWKARAYAKNT